MLAFVFVSLLCLVFLFPVPVSLYPQAYVTLLPNCRSQRRLSQLPDKNQVTGVLSVDSAAAFVTTRRQIFLSPSCNYSMVGFV